MANTVLVKRSAVAAKVPTTSDLALGEIGINTYDGKMYIKKDNGSASIVELLSTASVVAIANGGTGSTTAAGAATNLGLGTGDSPQFTAVNIGHATDTTITRSAAGVIAVEGGIIPKENRSNTFSATQYIAAGYGLIVGYGGGSVALALNDGYGNANVAFNHVNGTPDQNGSSGRIAVAVDSTSAYMAFQLGDSVTSGVAVGLSEVFALSKTSVFIKPNGTETFRFGSNGSLSIGSGGTGYGTSGQFMMSNGNAAPSWASLLTVTTYTSGSGNWTIPAGKQFFRVRLWGGGGSGGRGGGSTQKGAGGGGGGYLEIVGPLASLGSAGATVAYSVGLGASGVSAGGSGNTGGNTTFGTAPKQLTAYGGGGGGGNSAAPAGGSGGGFTAASNTDIPGTSMANLWAGGQGGGMTSSNVEVPAEQSIYGGAGGGGAWGGGPTSWSGTVSIFGGTGGNGATSGTPSAGAAPGGGGGGLGASTGTSGAGANGRIEIWVW